MIEKKLISNVELVPLETVSEDLCEEMLCKCVFCGKTCDASNKMFLHKLVTINEIYCTFCLRHNFYKENKENILILSFRSVFAYMYYQKYLQPLGRKMWLSEIHDYIDSHVKAGELNPLFVYDPITMFWFVDFSKVSKNKVSIDEVYKTIVNILACFNLNQISPGVSLPNFYLKYKTAIDLFHNKRYRPKDKIVLAPSLKDSEKSKNFTINHLIKKNS